MPIPVAQFLREFNVAAAVLLGVAAILCGAFSRGRGLVQLSYSVNNTYVATSPRRFDVGFVYVGTLSVSCLHRIVIAVWPERVARSIASHGNVDVLLSLVFLLPAINVAAMVGIGGVTDIFAAYAAAGTSALLVMTMWLAMLSGTHFLFTLITVTLATTLYLSMWAFAWAETVVHGTPLLLFTLGTVVILLACMLVRHASSRAIVRAAALDNASVALQMACAAIWIGLHHSATALMAPFAALLGSLVVYGCLCTFVLFRLSGTFIEAVKDDDDELCADLLSLHSSDSDSDGAAAPFVESEVDTFPTVARLAT